MEMGLREWYSKRYMSALKLYGIQQLKHIPSLDMTSILSTVPPNESRRIEIQPHLFSRSVGSVCACIAGIEEGKHIHNQILKSGLDSDIFVGIALLHMYGKFGCGYIKNVFVGIYWLRFLLTMGMF